MNYESHGWKIYDTGEQDDHMVALYGIKIGEDGMPRHIFSEENLEPKPDSKESEFSQELDNENLLKFNTRALLKDAETYELEKFEKKSLVIFNQVNVKDYDEPRLGTEADVEALVSTFENLGFEAQTHSDFTKREILDELQNFSARDFTDYGCIAIVILTHGSTDGLLKAADEFYTEAEVINFFRSHEKPTLFTKPVIIMIQACRGTASLKGVPVFRSVKVMKDDHVEIAEPYTLPVEADMLIVHSSYIKKPSFRTSEGTWFIQSLCNKINLLAASHDLESIITDVCHEVAVKNYVEVYNRKTFVTDTYKQMPTKTSTLTRKLYLKKFGDPGFSIERSTSMASNMDTPSTSREVLEEITYTDTTSSGACLCYLKSFGYIRKCLRHFLEENPEDKRAEELLALADTYLDLDVFNMPKLKMLPLMCTHLLENAANFEYFKYLNLDL